MNIDEVYNSLVEKGAVDNKDSVKIRTGFFDENDLIEVFVGDSELYFKIDKESLIELVNTLIPKINWLPESDSYNYMYNVLYLVQKEIDNYFGYGNQDKRSSYYMLNGSINEYNYICSMGQLKDEGIAKCAEKASVANNVLLILKEMKLFDYEVSYVKSLLKFDDMPVAEGHAFLEFNRVNSSGNIIHIIFDVTNPEKLIENGKEKKRLALYLLKDDEYNDFLNGGSFDSSKFIDINNCVQIERRVYSGFSKEEKFIR